MHLRLLYKKFLCVFMSLMIVIFSTQSAYAVTSVGGWTATDSLIAGANRPGVLRLWDVGQCDDAGRSGGRDGRTGR